MASSTQSARRNPSATLARGADRVSDALSALGPGALGWPVAIGTGLFAALTAVLKPTVAPSTARGWPLAMAMIFATAALAFVVAVVSRRFGDSRSLGAAYSRALHRFAFLTACPLCVAFREPLERQNEWLAFALAAVTGTLVTYSAYHWVTEGEPAQTRFSSWLVVASLGVLMIAYASATTYITIVNHLSFNTGRSDLGYYLSVFRQSSEGIPLGCSLCGGGTHTTGHFDPIIVLLSPLFLIYPWAETLLILQTLWLTSGAVPVYLLIRRQVGHRGAALGCAAAYLAYPALHGVNFFDFHSIALCIPPMLWFLYFIDQGRSRASYLVLGLLLIVREDVSLATCLIGISCLFSGVPKRVRIGWVTIALSITYFLVAKMVFMGHADPLNAGAGGKGYAQFYEEMIPAGRSTGALLGTVIGDPVFSLSRIFTEAKVTYLAQLLVPLLGLPLLAKGRIQLAYGAAVTLLATTSPLFSVHFQYSSTLIPILFGLTASALGRVRSASFLPLGASGPRLGKALAFGVLVSTLLCSSKFGALLPNESFSGGFRPLVRTLTPDSIALDAWLRSVARSFPKGAKVAANSRLLPHLGRVSSLYMIEDRRKADYIVANMKNGAIARPVLADEALGYLVEVKTNGNYRVYRTKYPKAMMRTVSDGEVDGPSGS